MTDWDSTAEILKALSSENRVKTFIQLAEDRGIEQILDDVGISRSGIQHYIDDYKETGLIRTEGKEYVVTEKGVRVAELLEELRTVEQESTKEELEKELAEMREKLEEHGELSEEAQRISEELEEWGEYEDDR